MSNIRQLVDAVTRQHQLFVEDITRREIGVANLKAQIKAANDRLGLIDEAQTVLKEKCLPVLTRNSIVECEELANKAIQQVFGLDYKVEWDVEGSRFLLNNGEYVTDLVDGNGGGISTLISFVFNVFLISKTGSRRLMVYDEAFTQVSAQFFPMFIKFVRDLCKTLNIDLLLISHDQRITADDVDHVYRVENNTIKKLK